MKIAFNVDYKHQNYTGIGRYGIELVSAFAKLEQNCELWMWRNTKKNPPVIDNFHGKIKYYHFPKKITDYFLPTYRKFLTGIDWIHSANGELLPKTPFLKQITMIHDMSPFLYSQMKSNYDIEKCQRRIINISKNADCIVVNSNSTKNDVLNMFPELDNRISLTPLGIDHFSSHNTPRIERKHILTVGTVEPRKNIDGLLKAYSILNQQRDIPPLVIAGMDGFKADGYKRLAVELKLLNKVKFTGFITDEKLASLYSEAYCLVHPAHHEGFGFTVPEAFTWGLPVVASNVGGLGEFFSKAAWMVNPSDIESITSGITNALDIGITPDQEKERKLLKTNLTWEKCAKKTINAIERTGS